MMAKKKFQFDQSDNFLRNLQQKGGDFFSHSGSKGDGHQSEADFMSEHMEDSDDPDRKVDSPTYPHTLFRQVVQKLKSYKDEGSQTDLKMIGDASLDHREKTV